MKVALVLGCSGSGKGYVVDQLAQPCQIIRLDLVRRDVLFPLRPMLADDHRNRWPVWDALIPHFDVVPAFAKAITARYEGLNANTPIVAEGGLIAHIGFRFAFLSALVRLGLDLTRERQFWIDPDPETIIQQRQKRSEKRESDRNITIQAVTENVEWYRSMASRLDAARFKDARVAISSIDEFLAS